MVDLTDEIIRRGRLIFRHHGGTAMAVLVGPQYEDLLGQMVGGLVVCRSPCPMEEDDYQIYGVRVSQPDIACADYGME